MRIALAAFVFSGAVSYASGAEGRVDLNRLTPAEEAAGWTLLFDGKSLAGWRTPSGEPAGLSAWTAVDGCLKALTGGRHIADLWTAGDYRNFDFQFEWRVGPGGNSGVRYFVRDWGRGRFRDSHLIERLGHRTIPESALGPGECLVEYSPGLEYQIVDEDGPRAPNPNRSSGALYALFAVNKRSARATGGWNRGRLLVRGNHVEHWLNGVKVVEYELDSEGLKNALLQDGRAAGEFQPDWKWRESPLTLQHHLTEVWFRNLKVRRVE